jgi:hypothetical protein
MKIGLRPILLFLAVVLGAGNLMLLQAPASAAPLTTTYLRLNRMTAGTTTNARLVFKTGSAGATSVSINMNGADTTTWTGSSGTVNTTQTASSASCAADSGATALPGTLAASGSGSTVSITGVTALAINTTYCVDLTSATAFTVATANEYHPVITAGSDSTTIAVRTVSNDSIVVTATVPPTFNFVLSANADTFTANLAAGSVGITSGVTATVNTNARSGWLAWVKGTNTGLTSAAAAKTIAATTPGTSATLTAGTEGYVMGITAIAQGSGAGTTSATTAYDATGSAHGSGVDTSFRQIASSTGTAASAVLTLKERAAISSLTPAAADYTDTLTVIGAGNF